MSKLMSYFKEVLLYGLIALIFFIFPFDSIMNVAYIISIVVALYLIPIYFKRKKEVTPNQLRLVTTKNNISDTGLLFFGGIQILLSVYLLYNKNGTEFHWFPVLISGVLYIILSNIVVNKGIIEVKNNVIRFYDSKLEKSFHLEQIEDIEFLKKDMILTLTNGEKFHLSQMNYDHPNLQELSDFLIEKLSNLITIKINREASY